MIGTLIVRMQRAEVVARAFLLDAFRLRARVGLRLDEQLVEPLVAIADRLAIDLEHVAKLHPEVLVAELDEQQIRLELAALARLPGARAGADRPAGVRQHEFWR